MRVIIAYDPLDLSRNGTEAEVPDDEAAELIRRGRARLPEPEPELTAVVAPDVPASAEPVVGVEVADAVDEFEPGPDQDG